MADRARDLMVREVICVQEDMDLRDVAKLLLKRGITGAPVLDSEGNLAGVISQRDVLYYTLTRDDELKLETDFYHHVRFEGHRLPTGYQIEDTNTGRVSDVMTPVVHAVSESASLASVAKMMIREHIHRVIVRKGRKVAGIISALELLRAIGANGGRRTARKSAPRRTKAGAAGRMKTGASRRAAVSASRRTKASISGRAKSPGSGRTKLRSARKP